MNKKTTDQFIAEARLIYGNRYDYSKSIYTGNKNKIEIICSLHGSFWKSPIKHLQGQGCPICARENVTNSQLRKFSFEEEARKIHGAKYDYSRVIYKGARHKVEIICPVHGAFWQCAMSHLHGNGCPSCSYEQATKRVKYTTEDFISACRVKHNDLYSYEKTHLKNITSRVVITCPIHGDFTQVARDHLKGHGCPKCKISKGELSIYNFLRCHNISFECQKKFDGLKDTYSLSYDFWLPDFKMLIEYNGEQHYKPIKHFGGKRKYKKQQEHDLMKEDYAISHGYRLLIISYIDFCNIDNILYKNILKISS